MGKKKDVPPPASNTPSPIVERRPIVKSEKGMTCFNWFLVLFLLTSCSSALIFTIFEKATSLEEETMKQNIAIKAMNDRINELLKSEISNKGLKEIQNSLKDILKEKNKLQGSLKNVVDKISDIESTVSDMNKKIFQSESTVKSSENMITAMNQANDEIKSRQNDIDSTITNIKDAVAVSDTNVQFLSKELIRLDKLVIEIDKQMSKSQNEIITLYSDYVKRQGVDASDEQMDGVKGQVAKTEIRVTLLEEQSKKVVKENHDEMTRFSGDISEMQRKMNDQMHEFSQQVSKDIQSSMQSVLSQVQSSKSGDQSSIEKDFKHVQKLVVELHEKVTEMERSGVTANIGTIKNDVDDVKNSLEKIENSVKDAEVRSEKQITILTEHIKAIRQDDANLKKEIASLKQKA